jgi:hypothetical protein
LQRVVAASSLQCDAACTFAEANELCVRARSR